MEETSNWEAKLEEILLKKEDELTKKKLPDLRDQFGYFQTYYESIYSILLRKSLISEDPYKYDEKIAEVTIPSNEAFLESEKSDQMSQCLSAFHTQLEFLNTYYQFSVDFINLARIKNLAGLIQYIKWEVLDSASSSPISRVLSESLMKIKKGTDSISAQIVVDSITQIVKITKKIFAILGEMAVFHKEIYKQNLRRMVLPKLPPNTGGSPEDLKNFKKIFAKVMVGVPFYPELAKDVLTEEFSEQGAALKEAILKKLEIKEAIPQQEAKEDNFKLLLLQAIRFLAASGFQIEDAINKLTDNYTMITNRKLRLGEKIAKWLKSLFVKASEGQQLELEYFDVATGTTKSEKITFNTFIEELRKKTRIFASLTAKTSTALNNLRNSSEEKIFEFLNRSIRDLQLIHRRMISLGEYFNLEAPTDKKGKIRNCKIELEAIKNSIIKANQKKHEYVAAKEEQEQMKRLGIRTD